VQGVVGQQQQQHDLLQGPVVPAPRRKAGGAQKTQDCNRFAGLTAVCAAVGLSAVAAVVSQTTDLAVLALCWPVGIAAIGEFNKVLVECGDGP
jgi:hypothetical protein